MWGLIGEPGIEEAMSLDLPVQLDDVIINSQLSLRPSKAADYQAENHAIQLLLHTISEAPNIFWQRLAETALQLCRAGTAGVALLDNQEAGAFRLVAVAGVLNGRLNNTIPHASPFGVAIAREGSQLMYLPHRCFPAFHTSPPIVEALLLPFHVRGNSVGAILCFAHDDGRKFDREDERVGKTLASFAAAAWHIKGWRTAGEIIEQDSRSERVANQTSQEEILQPKRMQKELEQLTENLETRASEKTADLIAATDHNGLTQEGPENVSKAPQPSSLVTTVMGPVELAAFNSLLEIIHDYATLMKNDLNDPVKLREDIEAISAAVDKSAAFAEEIIKRGQKE